MRQPKKKLIFP